MLDYILLHCAVFYCSEFDNKIKCFDITILHCYYRPQRMSLRKGNVFQACVKNSVHRGCVCIPACTAVDTLLPPPNACWDTHPTGQTPHGQTPAHKQTPPWEDTILPSTYWETSPGQTPPRQTPPRQPLQRKARILLECILVLLVFFYYLYRFRKCWHKQILLLFVKCLGTREPIR